MRFSLKIAGLLCLVFISSLLFLHSAVALQPAPHVPFKIVDTSALQAYALAPSIVKENGKYHAFYCANSDKLSLTYNGEWDDIRHVSSPDGVNWSQPEIKVKTVATGTGSQIDNPSACDPSVIFWQEYYYLFYSAYRQGLSTVIQVARSATIDGTYATYTENGQWVDSLNPQATPKTVVRGQGPIRFGNVLCSGLGWPPAECPIDYGVGQQYLTVHNGKLQMWFTDTTLNPTYQADVYMMESNDPLVWNTARAVKLQIDTTTVGATGVSGNQTNEIKFDDAIIRFVMFRIDHANEVSSSLSVSQSLNGVKWGPFTTLMPSQNFPNFAGNSGFMSDSSGHVIPGENILVGFAAPYDVNTLEDTWGKWNLYGVYIPQSDIPSPPTCTSAGPDGDTTTANSGTRRAFVYGVSFDVTAVKFPTWSDVNGQDGIVYYLGVNDGGGTWHADVNLASHLGLGIIYVHTYLYSTAFPNGTFCDSANFTRTTKLGDINQDSVVDSQDYDILIQNFGKTGTNQADINSDGRVDIFDYNILVRNYGK